MLKNYFFNSRKYGPFLQEQTNQGNVNYSRAVQSTFPWFKWLPLRQKPRRDNINIQAIDSPLKNEGILPNRGRSSPRSGDPNGSVIREARGRGDTFGPKFDIIVQPDGYAWWYVDGISFDGTKAISIIGRTKKSIQPYLYECCLIWQGMAVGDDRKGRSILQHLRKRI